MVALAVTLAYLAGCIPTGLLLTRQAGIDVRNVGSGNIGATNVSRAAGARLGLLTLVGDALKGALPTAAARALGASEALVATIAVATVVGHIFPITLGLRGGKGVATALGTLIVSAPVVAAAAAGVFSVSVSLTRRVSVGSLLASIAVPPFLLAVGAPGPEVIGMTIVAGLIGIRHRENLVRLIAGTEPKLGSPKN